MGTGCEKVTFKRVKKQIIEHGRFKGFVVSSSIDKDHFFSGWMAATKCDLTTIQQAEQFRMRMTIRNDNNHKNSRIVWYRYT